MIRNNWLKTTRCLAALALGWTLTDVGQAAEPVTRRIPATATAERTPTTFGSVDANASRIPTRAPRGAEVRTVQHAQSETIVASAPLPPGAVVMSSGDSMSSVAGCTHCGQNGDTICNHCSDKTCDRCPCPCPPQEVLNYYRCNHYGHYPTFWRPWGENFLQYRPVYPLTIYDRFRKDEPTSSTESQPSLNPDLERELQNKLQSSPRAPRRPPELLPNRRPSGVGPQSEKKDAPRDPINEGSANTTPAKKSAQQVGYWEEPKQAVEPIRKSTTTPAPTVNSWRAKSTPTGANSK